MDHRPDGFDVSSAFRDHGTALLGFAVNALRDRALAEDCVQETFLRAWRSRSSFDRSRGGERTWLFAIARNVVADALRARERTARTVAPAGEDDGTDPPAPAARAEERLDLLVALSELPEAQREAVVAIHLTGYSYAELSERLDVPVATLRTRVHYGLRAARRLLTEHTAPTGRSGSIHHVGLGGNRG